MFEVDDCTNRKVYLVGSGIASLAAADYLIRDGGIRGEDIAVYEEASQLGGALDAHGRPETGYFMSGSRMFEHKYNATPMPALLLWPPYPREPMNRSPAPILRGSFNLG
jgi:myosin-crossreactive antigen